MKNRHILILAPNARQGAKYAKHSNLPNFTYRVIRSASSITGIQSVDVHLVDGFESRPDAGAILARLRWARDIAYYSVEMPPEPIKDQGDGMGEQIEIDFNSPEPAAESPVHEDEASANDVAERAPETSNGDNMTSEGAPEPEKKKRRTRCKTCGRLTNEAYGVDPEGHDAAAHSNAGFFG